MKPGLLLVAPVRPIDVEALKKDYDVVQVSGREGADAAIDGEGKRFEIVVTIGQVGIDRARMDKMPNLKVVLTKGAGYEGIDTVTAKERGIAVANGSGTNSDSVADHAIGLLIAVSRNIVLADKRVRTGLWKDSRNARPIPSGKRIGIVGLGQIGTRIAKRAANGFDMKVSYTGRGEKAGVPYRFVPTVEELARESDYLVLSCEGGAATRGLVNAKVLEALGPKGFLVNVSRASVVDADAIVDALVNGKIAGAALDLWEGEPSPAIPQALLDCDNVILSPHMGARSPESSEAAIKRIIDNLAAFYAGGPMASRVV